MSFVAEIIAKYIGEEEGIDWRRIVQLIASFKNFPYDDVRVELSGLRDIKEKIFYESLKYLIELRKVYKIENLGYFDLVGSEEEKEERRKKEIIRKRKIFPYLLRNAQDFVKMLIEDLYTIPLMAILRGSASIRSPKLFIYYEENKKIIFISDVDIYIILPFYPEREVREYVKRKAYEFSLKTEIPINPYVTHISSIDNSFIKYGYPLLIKIED
jgi:hypothetical protein